jgi:hypothetical protein
VVTLYLLLLAIISRHELHNLHTNKFSTTYWVSSEPGLQPGQAVCGTRYMQLIYDIFPSPSQILRPENSKVTVIYSCLHIKTLTESGMYCTSVCRLRLEQHASCTWVHRERLEEYQSCTSLCKLRIERYQSHASVCRLRHEQYQSYTSVCILRLGQYQSCTSVCRLRLEQ